MNDFIRSSLFRSALCCVSLWTVQIASAADTVHFAAIGDFGIAGKTGADPGDKNCEKIVADLVNSWQPEFIITLGDNNYDFGDADSIKVSVGGYYGAYLGGLLKANRFFPCLGNHDWREGKKWAGAAPDKPLIKPYLDYFSLPGNERYYEFARGPVHFFCLDSDPHEPDGTKSDSVQALWLKDQLSKAKEAWKLVYFHEPPYSGGPKHGPNLKMRWPFKEWGASVVLCGHEHNYQHFYVDGLDYIINGLGGGGRYKDPVAKTKEKTVVPAFAAAYGAMKIVASDEQMTLEFITTTGKTVDTLELKNVAQ